MLYYVEAGISFYEVPEEKTLSIYISGCTNHCKNCHYSELRRFDNGILLMNSYKELIEIYLNYISCVCFLGEGDNSLQNRYEFETICHYIKKKKLKSCLYSGRNCKIEKWMYCFDYVKLGSYQEEKGPLTSKDTNQAFYKKDNNHYMNITNLFWNTDKQIKG